MFAGGYSFTGIGALFYTLLALIGVIIRHFRKNATRRKHISRPILASVLFTVYAIVTVSLLNAYRIIDFEYILNLVSEYRYKLKQNLTNIFSYTTHMTDIKSSINYTPSVSGG
jgi:hypothetical protein